MERTGLKLGLAAVLSVPLVVAVVLMASRLGDQARFVTWPVVAFTVLAATVAVVGVWTGARQPGALVVGLLPAAAISYVLPAAPFPFIAAALIAAAALAVVTGGAASGIATGVGTLMVVFVVLQGPAVECGATSVSTSSGPWWIEEAGSSTAHSTSTPDGRTDGTLQVGRRHYEYACDGSRLVTFQRRA